MNPMRRALGKVTAQEEAKERLRAYLKEKNCRGLKKGPRYRLAFACACLLLLLGMGGYQLYLFPVSYISIDVNPSIELTLNRLDRVIQVVAYNDDGVRMAEGLALENRPYEQAIDTLMEDAQFQSYLAENAQVVFTVVSDREAQLREGIESRAGYALYGQYYAADTQCLHEAHENGLSVGKYRAYLELTQYDDTVSLEDCHSMTMGELQQQIKQCQGHKEAPPVFGTQGHDSHHAGHHN